MVQSGLSGQRKSGLHEPQLLFVSDSTYSSACVPVSGYAASSDRAVYTGVQFNEFGTYSVAFWPELDTSQ